jgi:hypothetical protein
MNKNTSVTMAVAGILTLAVMTMSLQHHAFAQGTCPPGQIPLATSIGFQCFPTCDPPQQQSTGVNPNANEWDPLKQSTGGLGSLKEEYNSQKLAKPLVSVVPLHFLRDGILQQYMT